MKERKSRKLTMLRARGFDYRRRIPSVTLSGVWLKNCKISVEIVKDGKLILTRTEAAQ